MRKRTIRESSKPVLSCNSSSATRGLMLSGDIETNLRPVSRDNQETKPKSDRLPSSTRELCNKTMRLDSKKLMCIHCTAILIIKNSRKAYDWVCESCHFNPLSASFTKWSNIRKQFVGKELPFSGLHEFHKITATSTTINSVDYENIHISNFKSHRKHQVLDI